MRSRGLMGAVLACTIATLASFDAAAQTASPPAGDADAPAPGTAETGAAETGAAEPWFPQSVERRDPPFFRGGAFTRLDYHPLDGAREPWALCAVLPPQDFEYFRALAAGVRAEAARQGVRLTLDAVESFDAEAQAAQVDACLQDEVDAVLVAPVARTGLEAVLSRARARGVPVIELVTGAGQTAVTARIATDRAAVGRAAGRFLAERHPAGATPARVVWLYGPPGSAVAREMDRSFRNGIADSAVEIVHAEAVTLTDRAIRRAIRDVIADIDDFDALAGGSRTVQIAAEEIAGAFPSGAVELVTVTLGASTLAGIEAGRVFAGVNDKVVVQGRIGVDLAIRAVEERPHMVDLRPTLEIVDRSNVETFDRTTILPPE